MVYLLGIKENTNVFFTADSLGQATGFFQELSTGKKIAIPSQVKNELFKIGNRAVTVSKFMVEVSNIDAFEHGFCLIEAELNKRPAPFYLDSQEKEIKAIGKQFLEAYASHDMTNFAKLLHPHCIAHTVHGDIIGAKDLVHIIELWRQAFCNMSTEVISVSSYENLVEVHWVIRGIHQGFLGDIAPTGCPIELPGVNLCHVVGSQIIETWGLPNMEVLRVQLGQEKKLWDSTFSLVHLLS